MKVVMVSALIHEFFMREALVEANKAYRHGEVPIGALLVKQDKILARAYNLRESSGDPTAHAEMLVLREGGSCLKHWRLAGTILYVTLEPCPMCAGALVQARVDKLVYGAADPKAGAVRSLYRITEDSRLNHCLEVIGGVLEEECSDLMKDFFQKRR